MNKTIARAVISEVVTESESNGYCSVTNNILSESGKRLIQKKFKDVLKG